MFGALRQGRRVDLHHRADHHEVPVRPQVGDAGDEIDVHALVDDAEEAEPRMRGSPPGRRARLAARARLGEMGEVDRGREGVDVAVPVALGLVEAHAAGEDEVGAARTARSRVRSARCEAPRKSESSSMLS